MLPHHDGGGCDGCDRVNDDGTLARTVCEEGGGCWGAATHGTLA